MTDKTQLLQRLRQLQQDNPERSITRDFFRKTTEILDSAWAKYYGSWIEFKVAAGLEQNKTIRKFYADISKHAAFDSLREVNETKQSWGSKYEKPDDERFQTILAGSDVHGRLCDPFWRRLFIDTALRSHPSKIILVGDVFDFPHFSKYTNDPRKYDVVGEVYWVQEFLRELREAAPNAEIILLEGNHSARLVKYLQEQAPNVIPLLEQFHGMDVNQLIGLDKFEVNYIAKANLAVFNENEFKNEISKNYYVAYDTIVFHHYPQCKTWGLNAQSGHHHTIESKSFFTVDRGPIQWVQAGCGHIRNASYTLGERWQNGFALWHVDTHKKLAQPEIINCSGSAAVIGGKWYVREETETLKT